MINFPDPPKMGLSFRGEAENHPYFGQAKQERELYGSVKPDTLALIREKAEKDFVGKLIQSFLKLDGIIK